MSLLAPLYLLGALAVTLPLLLHLIRRTPQGRQPFSSLMFLTPSPPRITRRSRIEHWLLLLLRAAAIGLLALAFCRPFLRETASLLMDRGPGQRLAIVVDTSASMRRGDLWRQVIARTERLLEGLGPADEVGLFAYDDAVRMVVDWDEPLPDLATRRERIRSGMKELSPGWGRGNLGQALVTVADRLAAARGDRRDDRPSNIVVLSDLQHGTDTSALQAYEWPSEVLLQTEVVSPSTPGNAAARLLDDPTTEEPGWRVRVTNAAGATGEQFRVGWGSTGGLGSEAEEISVYVPAGQSRVVKLGEPPAGADRVQLSGDAHPFDNEFYFSPIQRRDLHVAVLGQEASDDPQGLRYFLERVWTETPRRKVVFQTLAPGGMADAVARRPSPVVVVTTPIAAEELEPLRRHVRQGGAALLVAADPATAQSLLPLAAGVDVVPSEPPTAGGGQGYLLLSEIDFRHPVFASFAGPRYNDFTKVRFWKHQRFRVDEPAGGDVLARFDNGDPALWEQPLGNGRLMWLAGGWRPADSQLALSSKFVPLLSRVLDHLVGVETGRRQVWQVRQPLPLEPGGDASIRRMTRPDGSEVALAADAAAFPETDQPGIYRLQQGTSLTAFAVNLDPAESDTAPLSADHLPQLGVRVGRQPTAEERMAHQRQMRDIELESRQKLWRWLLVGVLGILGLETAAAGWLARRETDRLTGTDPAVLSAP